MGKLARIGTSDLTRLEQPLSSKGMIVQFAWDCTQQIKADLGTMQLSVDTATLRQIYQLLVANVQPY